MSTSIWQVEASQWNALGIGISALSFLYQIVLLFFMWVASGGEYSIFEKCYFGLVFATFVSFFLSENIKCWLLPLSFFFSGAYFILFGLVVGYVDILDWIIFGCMSVGASFAFGFFSRSRHKKAEIIGDDKITG